MLGWAGRPVFQIIKRYISDDSAVFAPIMAMVFTALIGMVGLGVDVGAWMMQKRQLQTAVDAAALAGAYELSNGLSNADAEAAALLAAQNNGYDSSAAGADLDVVFNADGDGLGNPSVQTTIQQPANRWFSRVLYDQNIMVGTTATAQVEANDGVFCMLSLDPNVDKAITTSGSVSIDAQGCGLAVNSDSDTSLYLNGNVVVNVGDVHLAGNFDVVGGAAEFNYTNMRLHSSQTKDPYGDLTVSGQPSTCSAAAQHHPTHINSDTTLTPGVYCGGITMSGNEVVTLQPGTYYIDGGDFSASGGGSITGNGVTIILTNSGGSSYGSYGAFSVSGGKDVMLTAPTSGYYSGVAIYQDRNISSCGGNTLTGTSGVQVDGVIYTPSCGIDFGGNNAVTSAANICSKIISKTITFHGNPTIGSNCDGHGTRQIGAAAVKLVI
jgi:Flp pilus assembly protein TadG